jgi:hypothetical protein
LSAPPAAPEPAGASLGEGDSSGAVVASALAAASVPLQEAPVAVNRLEATVASRPGGRAAIAHYWQQLEAQSDPRASELLGSLVEAAEAAAIDEWIEGVAGGLEG